MNIKILTCMAAALALAATGCSHTPKDDGLGHDHSHHHAHEHSEHEHSEDEHGHQHGPDEITLQAHTANELGVATITLQPSEFCDIVKVSGSVTQSATGQSVVASTASGILTLKGGITPGVNVRAGQVIGTISAKGMAGGDANASAKAALDAAKRELDRLTPLHKEGIVSTRDYNAARAAYESARAAYSGSPAGGVATARTSGVIMTLDAATGQYVEAGQPIATIGNGNALMLQADLPGRLSSFVSQISSANVRMPGSDRTISLADAGGELINASTTSTQRGYIPIYFSLPQTDGLMPGTSVEVYLLGAPRSNALVIPRDAVTEQQGTHYAYVQLDDDCYAKRLVTLGNSDGKNVEILSGLKPGDKVVTKGAIMIKLAESSGAVPEGHSHNH